MNDEPKVGGNPLLFLLMGLLVAILDYFLPSEDRH